MKRLFIKLEPALVNLSVHAQNAPTCLKVCNAAKLGSKRIEYVRVTNFNNSDSGNFSGLVSQFAYAAPASTAKYAKPLTDSGSATCLIGPRGGTYTNIASGRENYSRY